MTRLLTPFVGRALIMWLVIRVAFYAFSGRDLVTGAPVPLAERLALEPPAMLAAGIFTVALVFIDIAALKERTFLANLGVDREPIAATVFLTALVLEALVSIVVGVAL